MKGFAHIGVMRALEERGIHPTLYAGTSIGALLASAAVAGMPVDEMRHRAEGMRRRDLFRINHMGMLMERMRSPSIYLAEPLRELVQAIAPSSNFSDLSTRLLVNTVDIGRATQVVWGSPGLEDASVQDAVYASCALPGFFPPGQVAGRTCVDGGVIDNVPVQIAGLFADVVIAVDVGNSEIQPITEGLASGFANIYMRAASTMMHALQQVPLTRWSGPPMVLIRPHVDDDWLSFSHTAESIAEGYRSAISALEDFDTYVEQAGGVYPRREVELEVVRDRCIGCGLCAALAPNMMGLDATGKAFARTRATEWSPADGDFVHHCPTDAIIPHTVRRIEVRKSGERERRAG
jgi:NTE family protein